MRAKAGRGLVALLTVLTLSSVGAPRADAIDPATVASAAEAAYGAYQKFFGNQLTLQQATDQIIAAIDSAKTQIISHMDLLAAADAKACAKAAVIDVEDIATFTADTLQAFARDTTACLTRVDGLLGAVSDKGAIDQLGFTLNGIGPIVLLARARAGFSTTSTRQLLIADNNTVISRLAPSCTATPLFGDAEPGGIVEVMLRCRAYNGDTGYDTAFSRTPRTATWNFTDAANQATRNTSRALAQAVLPRI